MFDASKLTRLIIYGGSFDPPHRGHIMLPFAATRQTGAEAVMYIPAGQPPHKKSRTLTPAHHRLKMLELALGDRDDATICTWEIDRGGDMARPNYTVDTLEYLHRVLGDHVEMRLLIGADMALIFDQWHQPHRIEQLAEPLVMLRPPNDAEQLLAQLPAESRNRWRDRLIATPQMDIASTELRRQLAAGDPIDPPDALDPAVLTYIREHGLYRTIE